MPPQKHSPRVSETEKVYTIIRLLYRNYYYIIILYKSYYYKIMISIILFFFKKLKIIPVYK